MLEIRNLTAGYPGRQVLYSFSACIPAGQVTVLLGPNGCGKSTFLKTLCGILAPSGGEITLAGEDLLSLAPRTLAQRVAYLSQGRRVPDITVGRLVLHGRFPYLSYPRRYRREDYAAAEEAMARMGLSELGEVPLEKLSGGQRQKAYIAMALAQDTEVVLLDEPTAYLDAAHQLQLMDQAKLLAKAGKTVVMVLHDLPLALRGADRVLVMAEGKLRCAGAPGEVYEAGMLAAVFGIRLGRTGEGYYYIQESREGERE